MDGETSYATPLRRAPQTADEVNQEDEKDRDGEHSL
jgi:hypothetical protein